MTLIAKLSGSTAKPTPRVAIDASGPVTFTGRGTVQMTATGTFTCRDPLPHASEFECKGRARLCAMALGRRSCSSGGLHMPLGAARGFLDPRDEPRDGRGWGRDWGRHPGPGERDRGELLGHPEGQRPAG